MDESYHPAPVAMPARADLSSITAALQSVILRVGQASPRPDPERDHARDSRQDCPLSGTEHLVSHLIDMAAEQAGNPVAFHGAQVAVATIPVAAAWEAFLAEFDPSTIELDSLFPDEAGLEPVVREAFAVIDPSGGVGEECWNDYARKLVLWRRAWERVERFFCEWPEHRARCARWSRRRSGLAAPRGRPGPGPVR